MTRVVERNIDALIQRQREEARARGVHERLAYAITSFAGSLRFVFIHVVVVAAWIVVNTGWTPLQPFDPTFVILATAASVEAIFLTSFVLITQNKMQADADRRADLDLQVSLLAEQKTAKLIALLEELHRDLPEVRNRLDAEAAAMEQSTDPQAMLAALDAAQEPVRVEADREPPATPGLGECLSPAGR